ncbi:MAG TPA: zinc-binding dehydrogenase [Candidatus Dorea intestinavium]|nr:zinc-binding dehydrogenase [Candidatus Dorea intestinavium]
MKAVLLRDVTPAKQVHLEEVEIPPVRNGWVLVKVKAFGMNHSEQILRLSEIKADYIQKPIIPGIECVGEIADASDSDFKIGQKVVALMAGMGRNFNGSYAEYALLPTSNVFVINSELPWNQLGAIPETYFTAWGSLFDSLRLSVKDTLLIRGATSSLGYAALQLAKALGCKVIATTHKKEKLPLLAAADEAIVDTGVLGGIYALNGFDPIKEIPNGVYLTGFFSNYPTQAAITAIFDFIKLHQLKPAMGKSFTFADIQEACQALDEGQVQGKIVVTI